MSRATESTKKKRKRGVSLPPEEVAEIIEELRHGASIYSLAKRYGHSTATIHRLKERVPTPEPDKRVQTEVATATRTASMRSARIRAWEALQGQAIALVAQEQGELKRDLDMLRTSNMMADAADARAYREAVELLERTGKITGIEPPKQEEVEYERAPRPNGLKIVNAHAQLLRSIIDDLGMVTSYLTNENLDASDESAAREHPGEVIARRLASISTRLRAGVNSEGGVPDEGVAGGAALRLADVLEPSTAKDS